MSLAIVYAFAVEERLVPVVGAPTFAVLARQLPRLVVSRMNRAGDQGVRFFPLLGPVDGKRQFFSLPDMLPPERLVRMHGQEDQVSFVVDGRVEAKGLAVRIHDAASLRPVFEETLAFDPLDPFPAVKRIVFELTGLLGWGGAPLAMPDVAQPALSYYLVARDDLLSLEAGFEREGKGHWLNAIATVVEHAPENAEVRQLLIDICRRLVSRDAGLDEVTALLVSTAKRTDDTGFVANAAELLEGMGRRKLAAQMFERLIGQVPSNEVTAIRLAGFLFKQARYDEGRDLLERAMAAGMRGARVLAQLAVFYERLGLTDERATLIDELARERGLSPVVARMVCCELVDQGRIDDALAVADDCLARHPASAPLWLEKARAHLYAEDAAGTQAALDAAAHHDPGPAVREEVARLRQFVEQPHILPTLRELDRALAGDDVQNGLRLAERVVKEHPESAEAWLFLGVVHQRLDQPGKAIAALRRAVDADPDLGEAHNRLGILLVGRGRYEEGHDHIERAIVRLPAESGPRIHMAQACFYLGRIEAGRTALRDAERLGASAEMVESVRRAFFPENG